jgi:predicted XRE-type DNA-binding protein
MKSTSLKNEPAHVTHGDIFDDLGFSPEETLEAKIKAEIWQALMGHIDRHTMTQARLAAVLKVHQPDVSNLIKGKISRFSITKLIQFAVRLNLSAEIRVKASDEPSSVAIARKPKAKVTRETTRTF